MKLGLTGYQAYATLLANTKYLEPEEEGEGEGEGEDEE